MKNAILKRLKRTDHLPMLFIGSGMSIRYLGLDNWKGLLRRFAGMAADNDYAYEMYEQQALGLDCKEGLLPKVAELIERDFNLRWFKDDQFKDSRTEFAAEISRSVSPFKIEIARYMRDKSRERKIEYAAEIELFRKLEMRSIGGVLTTNYDTFIEDLFPSYTKYIGQEQLLFSTLQGISEIYKIHGCCTKPESLVINEADYADFSEKNAYLAAKILTIFLEHPIVFIGYSITDTNIENILKSLVRCLSAENLDRIKERLMFVVRAKEGEIEEVTSYSKSFEGGKSIEMTRIRLKSYESLYQALLENQAKYNAPMLRRLKQDIYELVLTNKPTGKIRTINLEDEKLEDVEVVIGVGVLADFGQKGYSGITAEELYSDVVLDNQDFDAESIIWMALPTLLSRNSNSLPIFKYLAQYSGELPERVQAVQDKKCFDDLLSNTIKKNRRKHPFRQDSIASLCAKQPDGKCLQVLPHLMEENIKVDELHALLVRILTDNPSAVSTGEQAYKTDLKRAIRIYDWLKYHQKQKSPSCSEQ
ncbi:MAG: SIR2 family protein [Nitrospiraceae bacterium]|nr:SIR2 family protein [Nitrospiraceae bacterium]